MEKRQDKTTLKQIADYWINNNNIDETELNFDWSEAYTHCWNCGDNKYSESTKTIKLQRCHIVAHSLRGKDIPSNYVLLCKECHAEAPNTSSNEDMWDWIKSNYIPFSFYNTYVIRKALIMFKQKEGYSFFSVVKNIEKINKSIQNQSEKITTHGAKINSSTLYYMLKILVN
jgi:Zn finger protein HypA/HybF involved in hydrogenase expression